jgi:glutathione S-transferase
MTEKVFAEGSTCPELVGDKLRIYSMRYCPYAQRTRLVLDHLKIPHDVVNVHLKSKPDWFLAKNPQGLVPVLEQGQKIVYESSVCDEYLEDLYGNHNLFPADPYEKARIRILMELYSKVTDKFYGLLSKRDNEEEKAKVLEEMQKALDIFEKNISGTYFGGDAPCMLDFHAWPWFERIPMLDRVANTTLLCGDRFPKLTAWVKVMHDLPAVKATKFSPEDHYEFLKPALNGGTANYDYGL